MKTLPKFTRLTPAETNALIAAAQAGDEAARNRIVERNLRLVAKIASRVSRKLGCPEMLDEMFQVGVMGPDGRGGLMRAIECFDASKDLRFSTYAAAWITYEIRAVPMRDLQVAGLTVVQRRARIRRVHEDLSRALGRSATAAEVRADYVKREVRTPPTVEMIESAIDAPLVQIDFAELTEGNGVERGKLGDGHSREYALGVYTPSVLDSTLDAMTQEQLLAQAADYLAMLPELDRRVIEMHYGLGCERRSMPAIAKELGVSRVRVTQLRDRGLERMREAFASSKRAARRTREARRKLIADAGTRGKDSGVLRAAAAKAA